MGKKRKSQANCEVDEIVDDKKEVKKTKRTEKKKNKNYENPDGATATSQPVEKDGNKSDRSKPKKIIFVDDQPQEVPVTQDKKKKSRQKEDNHESNSDFLREEDVKDEDIDKFCDELNEEDNKQYENWVQLIEANLNSNKKKPK